MHATPTGPDATLGCRPRAALELPPSTGHPNRTGKIPSGLPAGPSKKLGVFFLKKIKKLSSGLYLVEKNWRQKNKYIYQWITLLSTGLKQIGKKAFGQKN